jgi:hypothetical protein
MVAFIFELAWLKQFTGRAYIKIYIRVIYDTNSDGSNILFRMPVP